MQKMNEIDENIKFVCESLCENLVSLKDARDSLQEPSNKRKRNAKSDALCEVTKLFLRNNFHLINAIALKIYSLSNDSVRICDEDKEKALIFTFSIPDYLFLKRYRKFLYALSTYFIFVDNSISNNLLFVFDFLYKTRYFLNERFGLCVLDNLDNLIIQEENLSDYRAMIAEKLENANDYILNEGSLFYISKTKPFFVNGKVYYELTVRHASEAFGKNAKFTVFSKTYIPSFYAVKLSLSFASIIFNKREMRIRIVNFFKVNVRFIEIDDLASILNIPYQAVDACEYDALMNYLTTSGESLIDIIDRSEDDYKRLKSEILKDKQANLIFKLLDKCRDMSLKRRTGFVTIRYAILKLRHRIMRNLISEEMNDSFFDCYLKIDCLPFEHSPLNTSLPEHNPHIFDLFLCLSRKSRTAELLSRKLESNAQNGKLFTPVSELKNFKDIKTLVRIYNASLPAERFDNRKLILERGKIHINSYVTHAFDILKMLSSFASKATALSRLELSDEKDFFSEQINLVKHIFSQNNLAVVFGSAGTGKTSLLNPLSFVFQNYTKLFLAKTNSAVENMKTIVKAHNCIFMTVDAFLSEENGICDILFVDECPTIDNESMRKVLKKVSCKAIFLTGDLYQIQSIRFGNWFALSSYFLADNSILYLSESYRTENPLLLDLFDKVRNADESLFDFIEDNSLRSEIDDSLFYKQENDEVILCFDYDGLYGINNLNSFLQNANSYVPEEFDYFHYKHGDPIIFAENNPYSSVLGKNLKGRIIKVEKDFNSIKFKIEVFAKIDEDKAMNVGINVCESEIETHSVIEFTINRYVENPFLERSVFQTVPFQLAYALSVYKVQGLEFDSVKIIISEESAKRISHSIFYTAISRAKKKLKIYCSEKALKILTANLTRKSHEENARLFAKYYGLSIKKPKQ